MEKVILWETPDKVCDTRNERFVEEENLVVGLLASGIQEVRLEARDFRMAWVFDYDEIKIFQNNLLSGKELALDYQKIIKARSRWTTGLTYLRDHIKNS